MYSVVVSSTFARQFRKLPAPEKERIRSALKKLGIDPYHARTGADIKSLSGTNPPKYRLRVGNYRIIFAIGNTEVKAIEVFIRGRGYRH